MKKIEISKGRYLFNCEFDKSNKKFIIKTQEINIKYSFEEEREVIKEIIIEENNFLRIGELIDALKYSDILHPISRDTQISPFGIQNKHFLHIKWIGWDTKYLIDKYPKVKKITEPEKKEIFIELNNLKNHIENYLKKLNNNIKPEIFYRKTLHLLINSISTMLPDSLWGLRGFLPTPFRVIEFKKFSEPNNSLKIKLTPFESRKTIRFFEKYYNYLED